MFGKMMIISGICLMALPAAAMKVTNLDHVPHTVRFEQVGQQKDVTLQPRESYRFMFGEGELSLMSVPAQKGSTVGASGVLAGVLGNGRTVGIPAGQWDEFVIWPGGKLHMQRRMRFNGGNF